MLSPILIGLAVTGALAAPTWDSHDITAVESKLAIRSTEPKDTPWIQTFPALKPGCMRRMQIVPPYVKVWQTSCLKKGAEKDSYFLEAFKIPLMPGESEGDHESDPSKKLKYGRTNEAVGCKPQATTAKGKNLGCHRCIREMSHQTVTIDACPVRDGVFYPNSLADEATNSWFNQKLGA